MTLSTPDDSPGNDTNDGGDASEHFVRLFALNQRRVHAYIGALLPNRNDLDDVMQETSISLWKKWSDYDPSRDFLRWACGIAYIETLRHKRKYVTQRLYFTEELMEEISEEVLNHSNSDESESFEVALTKCLSKLRESDRQLVQHRYGIGITAVGAARELGRPASTVYKALARIRKTLMECVNRSVAQGIES